MRKLIGACCAVAALVAFSAPAHAQPASVECVDRYNPAFPTIFTFNHDTSTVFDGADTYRVGRDDVGYRWTRPGALFRGEVTAWPRIYSLNPDGSELHWQEIREVDGVPIVSGEVSVCRPTLM